MVIAAFLGGLLIGGAGLASAATGNLPGPVQNVAHSVLATVGVAIPSADDGDDPTPGRDGRAADNAANQTPRFLGDAATPCTRPDGAAFVGNHGEYVAVHPDDPTTPGNERAQAVQSPCGKPMSSVKATVTEHKGKPADTGKPTDKGKPADTGKPGTPVDSEQPPAPGSGKPDRSEPAGGGRTNEPAGAEEPAPDRSTDAPTSSTGESPATRGPSRTPNR